jgi:hypothetical protein
MGRDTPIELRGSVTPRDRDITFERGMDFIVPYAGENISRCKCPQCPVQADSQCVQDEIKVSREAMRYMPAGDVPKPEYIPGVYCSEGKARCEDLDFNNQCICDSCEVWKEYDIKDADPNDHFCQHGRAT